VDAAPREVTLMQRTARPFGDSRRMAEPLLGARAAAVGVGTVVATAVTPAVAAEPAQPIDGDRFLATTFRSSAKRGD
jgi:hypothetical protein